MAIQLTVTSKYMIDFIEKETQRIEAEIIGAAYTAFRKAGFRVSVSRDPANRTERWVKSAKEAANRVLSDKYEGDYAWMFAYPSKYKASKTRLRAAMQAHWVQFILGNGEDILTDYSTSAQKILAPLEAIQHKYQ